MKLLRLTATFGCLDHATLEFGPGLTLIEAPNGGGKSTWCAFLRTMLYGLDTRQRDKKGAPADKNRYRPWNGAPMEGLLVCEHEGKRLELRRTSAGGVPMGEFSARWQETGLPVDGMTAETAGELLTGLSQEVFDRSVFLKQTDLAVSQSQELEKKITALVSTGEEDISFTEANDCLKTWLHRRRFHKTGQIPQLEAREEALRQSLDQTTALRQELDQLRARANSLRRQRDQWESRLSKEQDEAQSLSQKRHAEAAAELDAHFAQYELVVVDDACTDDTVAQLRVWGKEQAAPLTILHMSTYHGLENAMNAGLDAAIGDYVYEFDSTELCYPAELIFKAYQTALTGSDIVSVCPRTVRGGSSLFYKVFNAHSQSAYRLRTDAFRLVTRRAINRVHASSTHLPYRKAAYAASGLRMVDLEFDGQLTVKQKGRFNLALDSLTLYTNFGFKASVTVTLCMMALALAELIYTLVIFATGHPVEGWTTTMFVITVGFAGLFAVLTIVVKYLSLLLNLTFRQQKYLVESIEKLQK